MKTNEKLDFRAGYSDRAPTSTRSTDGDMTIPTRSNDRTDACLASWMNSFLQTTWEAVLDRWYSFTRFLFSRARLSLWWTNGREVSLRRIFINALPIAVVVFDIIIRVGFDRRGRYLGRGEWTWNSSFPFQRSTLLNGRGRRIFADSRRDMRRWGVRHSNGNSRGRFLSRRSFDRWRGSRMINWS